MALLKSGLVDRLRQQGHEVLEPQDVALTPEEESQYGGWNRVGLAGGHLAELVKRAHDEGAFVLGLLADCNGCLGVLGGLQQSLFRTAPAKSGPSWPELSAVADSTPTKLPRIGLVYVDAHGDYNTPDTSPSGMLGGMPVAVASGKCLSRLRLRNGLQEPIRYSDIVMAGMRDLDGPEREAIAEDGLTVLRERDLVERGKALSDAMDALSARVDTIYVHVDLDILDPGVAPAAGLPSPGGITGRELGLALKTMVAYPKVAALSLVSYRADQDGDGRTQSEVTEALLLATSGLAR